MYKIRNVKQIPITHPRIIESFLRRTLIFCITLLITGNLSERQGILKMYEESTTLRRTFSYWRG